MNGEYVMPTKELLIKNSERGDLEDKYYRLSKLLLKKNMNDKLLVPIGIDENREKYYVNLFDVSLMLIGGETGSGKSVLIDSIIVSLLLKNTPNDLNFIFIDPKKIELFEYEGIPHIINSSLDGNNYSDSVKLIEEIINKRLDLFRKNKVRNIQEYNDKYEDELAQIVIVIDEVLDMVHEDKFIMLIKYITQIGVITGVHLIMSTNMCIKEVFDKELLDLFEYILTFDLSNKEQSKFMSMKGAEFLKVYGEAMIRVRGERIVRVQAPYISDEEIDSVVEFIKSNNSICV